MTELRSSGLGLSAAHDAVGGTFGPPTSETSGTGSPSAQPLQPVSPSFVADSATSPSLSLTSKVTSAWERIPLMVKVYTSLFIVQFIFAVNVVLVRFATRYVPSLSVILVREMVCTSLLFLIATHSRSSQSWIAVKSEAGGLGFSPFSSPLWRYFLIPGGLLGVCGHLFLVSFGIQMTSAVTATIFSTSRPLFSATAIMLLALGKPSKLKFLGLLLGCIGEVVAVHPWGSASTVEGTHETHPAGYALGCLSLLTSNACYGMYLIILKLALLAKIPLPVFLSRVFLVGLIGLLVMFVALDILSLTTGVKLLHRPGGESTLFATLLHAPWVVWVIATWGGLIVSPVPYALNGFAIRHVSPIVVAIFSDIENPLCSLLAVVFLGEAISTWQIIGSAVVSIGVIVAAFDSSGMVTQLPEWLERRVSGPAEVELRDANQKEDAVATVAVSPITDGENA